MSNAFYRTAKWKHKRQRILRRDKYLCQECAKYGRKTSATTVHHITEVADAPDLALADSNLVALCAACHNKYHPAKGGSQPGKHYTVYR